MANEKFKDKIIKVFGMEMDDDDQYYDDEYYDDEVEEVVEEQPRSSYASQSKRNTQSVVKQRTGLTGIGEGPDVLVLDPERFEDAPGIVNRIKADKTVVVNLKNTEYEDGQKIFDFLNGAVFALDGSINRIADNVFILAPKQVSVSTSIDKPEVEESITPILRWEETK